MVSDLLPNTLLGLGYVCGTPCVLLMDLSLLQWPISQGLSTASPALSASDIHPGGALFSGVWSPVNTCNECRLYARVFDDTVVGPSNARIPQVAPSGAHRYVDYFMLRQSLIHGRP
eukprot:gb/GECG01016630.1/.p1 GENE.gb/GECG01016630.1/~~gb/GECG01016630.1/.p1  ORF type:complete len:116 (+),score=4.70 gb/GECG01016630.1/:1-348(+)